MAVAGALVAGGLIFLGVMNVVQGRSTDADDASAVVATGLSTRNRLRWAVISIWACAILIATVALSLYLLRESFTIVLIDEYGVPLDDAIIKARFGNDDQTVKVNRGRGVVPYYSFSAPLDVTVTVSYRGMQKVIKHTRGESEKFTDLTVKLFSGREVISAAHMTVDGIGIDAFLHGDLPPDLVTTYPHVVVLRNEVYDAARRFIDIYDQFDGSGLEYERAESSASSLRRVARAEVDLGDAEPRLKTYFERTNKLKVPRTIYVDLALDMSSDIIGYPTTTPLPPGFRLRLLQPGEWFSGDEGMPDESTSQWLGANAAAVGRTARGSVAISLDLLVSGSEVAQIMARARSFAAPPVSNESARAYLDYMIRNGAPAGLMGASFHIDPSECGGSSVEPHIALQLPSPELRVTLLKNTSNYPIKIQELISATRFGGQLWQMDQPAATAKVIRSEFDILEPGKAILVPRWIGLRGMYTSNEIAGFRASDTGFITTFHLSPRHDEYTSYDSYYYNRVSLMPRLLSIDAARVMTALPASERASASEILAGQRPPGPVYALGPVVDNIDYVINGVRVRTRPDSGSIISMIGTWETGSCPFVFAHRSGASPLNIGTIIRDRVGLTASGRDTIRIPGGTDRIELRELEDEISYIDAAVLVVLRDGQLRRIPARGPAVSVEDGKRAVLRRGDRLWLDFGYRPDDREQVWLEISGYYEPGSK